MNRLILLILSLLLSGCLEEAKSRVGWLSLLPFLLTVLVLWWLNRNRDEEHWDEDHYPDNEEDDDKEDHHLM